MDPAHVGEVLALGAVHQHQPGKVERDDPRRARVLQLPRPGPHRCAPVVVNVLRGSVPSADVTVIFHDAAGEVLQTATTGADGRATSTGPVTYEPFVNQQARQMDDFAECVREGRESRVPGEMGRRDLAIIEAIYAAAKSGKREPVRG